MTPDEWAVEYAKEQADYASKCHGEHCRRLAVATDPVTVAHHTTWARRWAAARLRLAPRG